jgi:signal peptide peptidase SppA
MPDSPAPHLLNRPLLIHPDYMGLLLDMSSPQVNRFVNPEVFNGPGYCSLRGVGVVNMSGVYTFREIGGWNTRSYQSMRLAFDEAMADEDVRIVLLDSNSPGGVGHGVFDFADHIYASRGQKRIVAIANEIAYSAAYALASAADEIVVPRSGGVGSVGAIAAHYDWSKYNKKLGVKVTPIFAGKHKNDGSPHQPLSEEALKNAQAQVDRMYSLFVDQVARNRGLDPDMVRGTEAGVFMGQTAVDAGLADRVMDYNSLITSLQDSKSSITTGGNTRMNAENNNSQTPDAPQAQASTPETQGNAPQTNTADTAAPSADLNQTLLQETEQRVRDNASDIATLCTISGAPERIAKYLADNTPRSQVERELLEARVQQQEGTHIDSTVDTSQSTQLNNSPDQHPLVQAAMNQKPPGLL